MFSPRQILDLDDESNEGDFETIQSALGATYMCDAIIISTKSKYKIRYIASLHFTALPPLLVTAVANFTAKVDAAFAILLPVCPEWRMRTQPRVFSQQNSETVVKRFRFTEIVGFLCVWNIAYIESLNTKPNSVSKPPRPSPPHPSPFAHPSLRYTSMLLRR